MTDFPAISGEKQFTTKRRFAKLQNLLRPSFSQFCSNSVLQFLIYNVSAATFTERQHLAIPIKESSCCIRQTKNTTNLHFLYNSSFFTKFCAFLWNIYDLVCKHKCFSFVFDLLFQCFDTDLTQRKTAKQFSAQKVTFSWRPVIVILYLAFEECNWLTVLWRLNRTTTIRLTESFCCKKIKR